MIYNWDLGRRIKCSPEEMKQCADLIVPILNMALKAKKEGLLSLEDDIDSIDSAFFRRALKLIVDGIDPDMVGNILEIDIISGDYTGKDLLQRCMYYEAAKHIQCGTNPKYIREILSSFFGDNYSDYIRNSFNDKYGESPVKLLEQLKRRTVHSAETSLLEKPVLEMDDKSLHALMYEVDTVDILMACRGASGMVFSRFLDNMSKNAREMMAEDLNSLCNSHVEVADIVAAQNRILKAYNNLKNSGY